MVTLNCPVRYIKKNKGYDFTLHLQIPCCRDAVAFSFDSCHSVETCGVPKIGGV